MNKDTISTHLYAVFSRGPQDGTASSDGPRPGTSEDEDVEKLFWDGTSEDVQDFYDLGTRTSKDVKNRDVLWTPALSRQTKKQI